MAEKKSKKVETAKASSKADEFRTKVITRVDMGMPE